MTEFWSNYNAAPSGPFTTANKQLAFAGFTISDSDPNGVFYSVTAGGGRYGDNCCRMHYVAGQFGANNQQFNIHLGAPNDIVNLEFDWMFEGNPAFDFPAGGTNANGGKTGPRIIWGGSTTGTGLRIEWWHSGPPPFIGFCDNLATGAVFASVNATPPIVIGQWYHLALQFLGGPSGFAKIWIDGKPLVSIGPTGHENIGDSVLIDFSSFFGGGGSASAPTYDCFARMDRVHAWTGAGPGTPYPYSGVSGMSASVYRTSNLATGPIGYVIPWTVNSIKPTIPFEYGYSFTFAIAAGSPAWPAGLAIDADTGLLSTTTAIAAGTYTLGVKVTNRRNTALISTFAITLQVDAEVSSGRTGTQWLRKIYDPHSGTWGAPTGNDWTTVFNAINAQILSDQELAGNDNNIRAYIPLRGNVSYDYTNNRWSCGTQFLEVYQDVVNFPGAKPKLRCIKPTFSFDTEVAPIIAGGGSVLDFAVSNPNPKTWASLIASCAVGDSTVTLLNAANASNLRVGRWHMVLSFDQQGGGGPPNSRYYDYVRITAISGAVVTLDRQLRHRHSATWWENFASPTISFGRAWIIPMDVGGAGGVEHGGTNTLVRLTQRQVWTNLEFDINPNFPTVEGTGTFCYQQALDTYWVSCVLPYPVPSITKTVTHTNCTIQQRCEFDKLLDLCVVDNCTVSGEGLGSGTGVEMLIVRNGLVSEAQSAPRQFLTTGTTWDIAQGPPIIPLSNMNTFFPGVPGPQMRFDLTGCTFKSYDVSQPSFLRGIIYFKRDVVVKFGTLGTDFSWSGNQLQVPLASASFLDVLGYAYEGMIVIAGSDPTVLTSWGYISNITSPNDGSALWLDIVWVAPSSAHPASGILGFDRCGHVTINANCVIGTAGTVWNDGGSWLKSDVPNGFGTNGQLRDWPAGGYPYTGF